MPFPTISTVLDNFNRADTTSTLGPDWSAPWINTDAASGWKISSNLAAINNVFSSAYYNVSTYGPDIEVYATMAVQATRFSLAARISEGGTSTTDGYIVSYLNSGTASDSLTIYRVDNGVLTQLGAAACFSQIDAGASLGLEIIGTTITSYYNRGTAGASWTAASSQSDSTYGAAGNLGMRAIQDTAMRTDNFIGGTLIGSGEPALGFAKRRTDWAGFRM